MHLYTLDVDDMQKNANIIKECVLVGLEREGLLKGAAADIGTRYAVVLHKKGWFGQFLEKLFDGIKEGSFKITFVKIID